MDIVQVVGATFITIASLLALVGVLWFSVVLTAKLIDRLVDRTYLLKGAGGYEWERNKENGETARLYCYGIRTKNTFYGVVKARVSEKEAEL